MYDAEPYENRTRNDQQEGETTIPGELGKPVIYDLKQSLSQAFLAPFSPVIVILA